MGEPVVNSEPSEQRLESLTQNSGVELWILVLAFYIFEIAFAVSRCKRQTPWPEKPG
jgi:hypothetical protein